MSGLPPRVLYIDDDDGLRRLVERGLTRRGFVVTPAARGREGVALATQQRFDLIAVDHYMPDWDGLETLRHLRALPEPAPVVYVTGSEEGRVAVAALKEGAADYVVKTLGEDFFDLLANTFSGVLGKVALERAKERAEAELRSSNQRLQAMLREVNHRVANSLQLVTAMVQLQSSALEDEGARQALRDTQRRIAAIAQVHRRLYSSDDVEAVDMRDYLGSLIDELALTWSSEAAPRHLNLVADSVRLPTDRAVSMGVIVNELVSNACKYAYGAAGGEVRVALHRDGPEHVRLSVEDDGVGLVPGSAPQGTGVGTRVLHAMAQSLQTALCYDVAHRGVRATLRVALR